MSNNEQHRNPDTYQLNDVRIAQLTQTKPKSQTERGREARNLTQAPTATRFMRVLWAPIVSNGFSAVATAVLLRLSSLPPSPFHIGFWTCRISPKYALRSLLYSHDAHYFLVPVETELYELLGVVHTATEGQGLPRVM